MRAQNKLLTIDDKWSMLGSANMDIRSFRLNFELNLLIYGEAFTQQAKAFFEGEVESSEALVGRIG